MFKPGHAKVGGRQKGAPNKATSTARQIFDAAGRDPLVEILRLIDDEELPAALRINVWLKLMSFVHPQLKSIELSGDPDKPLTATRDNAAAIWAAAREGALRGGGAPDDAGVDRPA